MARFKIETVDREAALIRYATVSTWRQPELVSRLPVGRWAVAGPGTPTAAPYPCRCRDVKGIHFGRRECGESTWAAESFGSSCACWGRVDLDLVPPWCCGRRKVWPGVVAA